MFTRRADEHVKFILKVIEKDKFITLDDLLKQLLDKFKDLTLSRTMIYYILQDK